MNPIVQSIVEQLEGEITTLQATKDAILKAAGNGHLRRPAKLSANSTPNGRKPMSAAARKRIGAAAKKRWREIKKTQKQKIA